MKTHFLNSENEWNELVFENRNKNYGAYVLRTEYDLTVLKSYLFTIGSLLLFALTFYALGRKNQLLPVTKDPTLNPTAYINPATPPNIVPPQPKPPVNTNNHPASSSSFAIDSTDRQTTSNPQTTEPAPSGPINTAGQGSPSGIENPGSNTGTGSNITEGATPDNPAVYADVQPEFPGGDAALEDFIRKRVNFYKARTAGIEKARIVVSFIVSPDGRVMNIEAVSSKGFGMEEAVIEAVSKMPRWNPGKIRNTNVYVKMFLPVQYELE